MPKNTNKFKSCLKEQIRGELYKDYLHSVCLCYHFVFFIVLRLGYSDVNL